LGASLHNVLTRLKAQNQTYPVIDLSFSPSEPFVNPITLNLPFNGFRLRFDGSDQRLRLIEVLDFTKTLLSYKDTDIVKLPEKAGSPSEYSLSGPSGPIFRQVYNKLFGPTFPGEYNPPLPESVSKIGLYVLSYPGVAFTFPLQDSAWKPDVDFVSLLSSHATAATTMAIFDGQSWPEARQDLMVRPCVNPRSLALSTRGKEVRPDEVELVNIRGNGKVDLERRNSPSFPIVLGETTPQDLIAELGPPDAIHRKFDRRLSIHRNQHRQQRKRRTFSNNFVANEEEAIDTDQSSNHTITDDSDIDDESQPNGNASVSMSAECFYNYFRHGFDVFISYPTYPSSAIPPTEAVADRQIDEGSTTQLVATKILLHANVPGSYPFNRYRRSRWVIDVQGPEQDVALNSETPFTTMSDSLQKTWRDGFANGSSKDSAHKAMVLNRDWGDSPGSSCEILGTWEETTADSQQRGSAGPNVKGSPGFGNTKLYGFPGLLFEVLKNDAVSCLTVY